MGLCQERKLTLAANKWPFLASPKNKSPKCLSYLSTVKIDLAYSIPHEFFNHRLAGAKPFQRLPILAIKFRSN
jgi:hypothetical protein